MKTIKEFFDSYVAHTSELLAALDRDAIESFMQALDQARLSDKTIFVAGNGGSASAASHMGTDFGLAFFKGQGHDRPFRMHPLTDVPILTAAGNDFGYEQVFVKQLQTLYREGDLLVVISASGSSPNVVEAARWMREQGGKVLGLLGFDGGALEKLCDISVVVKTPKGEYGPVEDIHVILMHVFTAWMHRIFAHEQ